MSNHTMRHTHYKGFTIYLVGEDGLWWHSILRDSDGYDFGGSTAPLPWTDAIRDAKAVCDDILANPDHFED